MARGTAVVASGALLLLAWANPVFADGVAPPVMAAQTPPMHEKAPRVRGDGGAVPQPTPESERPEATEHDHPGSLAPNEPEIDERSIVLDLGRLEAMARPVSESALLAEISIAPEAPGSCIYDWNGLEGLARSRIAGYGRRLFNQELEARWTKTQMTLFQYEAAQARLYERIADVTMGRWWERSWDASLLPEKGGAPTMPRIEHIGHEIEVFRLGEVAFTTAGKIRVGKLWFYLDDERIYERLPAREQILNGLQLNPSHPSAHQDAMTSRSQGQTVQTPKKEQATVDDRLVDVSLGWTEDDVVRDLALLRNGSLDRYTAARLGLRRAIPRGNVYTSRTWNLSLKPTITLHGSQILQPGQLVGSATLELSVRFFRESQPEFSWGEIQLSAQMEKGMQSGLFTANFELATW
jgi:hypothetical protein